MSSEETSEKPAAVDGAGGEAAATVQSSVDAFVQLQDYDAVAHLPLPARLRLASALTLLLAGMLLGFCFWNICVFSGGFAVMSWWPVLVGAIICLGVFMLPQLELPDAYSRYHRLLWNRTHTVAGLSQTQLQSNSWVQGKSRWNGKAPSLEAVRLWSCIFVDTALFWYFLFTPVSRAVRFAPYFQANVVLSLVSAVMMFFALTRYMLSILPRGVASFCFYLAGMATQICGWLFVIGYIWVFQILLSVNSQTGTGTGVLWLLFGEVPETMRSMMAGGDFGVMSLLLMMISFAMGMAILGVVGVLVHALRAPLEK